MICQAINDWIRQRPKLDPRNYISHWSDAAGRAAYRADARRITRQLHDAEELLRARAAWHITEAALAAEMTERERLTWDGQRLDYTAGQYWPIEYRAAACRALASALWAKFGPDARTMVSRRVAMRWLA